MLYNIFSSFSSFYFEVRPVDAMDLETGSHVVISQEGGCVFFLTRGGCRIKELVSVIFRVYLSSSRFL